LVVAQCSSGARRYACDPLLVFAHFTEWSRQVVPLALREARELRHGQIGPEHLLLGLCGIQDSVAAAALEDLGITSDSVRDQVVRLVAISDEIPEGLIPLTPRAKAALESASVEARNVGRDDVDTEHILFAVIDDRESFATQILVDLGASEQRVRVEVARILSLLPGGRQFTLPPQRRSSPDPAEDKTG
jgi:ATP-dependent Clp protease ATP-binding subunit ClpC